MYIHTHHINLFVIHIRVSFQLFITRLYKRGRTTNWVIDTFIHAKLISPITPVLLLIFRSHVCWKIDKSRWKKYFFETLFELFSVLFILPLCCQNHQIFLDWSEVFIMPNSFPFYLVFKVEKIPQICIKKWLYCCRNFLFQLRLWFWLDFVRYLTILGIFSHSWYVKKLMYTFIRS